MPLRHSSCGGDKHGARLTRLSSHIYSLSGVAEFIRENASGHTGIAIDASSEILATDGFVHGLPVEDAQDRPGRWLIPRGALGSYRFTHRDEIGCN